MEHLKFTRNWARAAMLLLTMLCCLTGARADEVTIGDLENYRRLLSANELSL